MPTPNITIGSQVIYTPTEESGYVKSLNEKFVFVVFAKSATKHNFNDFTAASCHWDDIREA